jgi:hypothetical protein
MCFWDFKKRYVRENKHSKRYHGKIIFLSLMLQKILELFFQYQNSDKAQEK